MFYNCTNKMKLLRHDNKNDKNNSITHNDCDINIIDCYISPRYIYQIDPSSNSSSLS